MRVLVVEDEERIATFLVKGLHRDGHEVDAVGTGRDALARAVPVPSAYDVVLLDLGLPDMDGLQVLAELRRAGVRTPVLVVTARLAVEDQQRAMDLGADDYLLKPFVFRDLMARVDLLGAGSATAPRPAAGPAPVRER